MERRKTYLRNTQFFWWSLSQRVYSIVKCLSAPRVDLHKTCVCACSVMSNSLQPHGLQPARLLCPWNFPGKNTGMGCRFLLPRIFWRRNQTCISCIGRQILYHWATWEAIGGLGPVLNKIDQRKQETLLDFKMHCVAGQHISSWHAGHWQHHYNGNTGRNAHHSTCSWCSHFLSRNTFCCYGYCGGYRRAAGNCFFLLSQSVHISISKLLVIDVWCDIVHAKSLQFVCASLQCCWL